MTQLVPVANNQLSDASQLNQYRTLYRGTREYNLVNGYGVDPTNTTAAGAGTQQAIDDAYAAGGGLVWADKGTYKMDRQLTLKDNVWLAGPGMGAVRFTWASDLGAGSSGLITASGNQINAPIISGIGFQGPGAATRGTKTCNMDGIYLNSGNVKLYGVNAQRFRAGVSMGGDHGALYDCQLYENWFNLEFPDGIGPAIADHRIENLVCDRADYACVRVGGDNIIDSTFFSRCHFAASPYVFIKENIVKGGAAPSNRGMFFNTTLHNCVFEWIGNAFFWDKSTGTSGGDDSWISARIIHPRFKIDPSFKIAAEPWDWSFKLRNIQDSEIVSTYGWGVEAGSIGAIKYVTQGLTIRQDNGVYANHFGSGSTWSGMGTCVYGQDFKARAWNCAGTVTAGDIVCFDSSWDTIKRHDGTGAMAGVAMQPGVAGSVILVQTEGLANVNCEVIASGGLWIILHTTTYHGVSGSPVLGKTLGKSRGPGGATGGTSTAPVVLQII